MQNSVNNVNINKSPLRDLGVAVNNLHISETIIKLSWFEQITERMSIKDMVFKKHLTSLKEGQKAPDFTTTDENGQPVTLADFKGKKIVLYFYPKDDTSGCTAQSCNLRDNYRSFQKNGYEVLGVSADDEKSHRKFIYKYSLPFRLLADVDHKLINAYDVWGKKMLFGKYYDGIVRTTFVVDEKGIIEKVITDVNTEGHTEQILNTNNQ